MSSVRFYFPHTRASLVFEKRRQQVGRGLSLVPPTPPPLPPIPTPTNWTFNAPTCLYKGPNIWHSDGSAASPDTAKLLWPSSSAGLQSVSDDVFSHQPLCHEQSWTDGRLYVSTSHRPFLSDVTSSKHVKKTLDRNILMDVFFCCFVFEKRTILKMRFYLEEKILPNKPAKDILKYL